MKIDETCRILHPTDFSRGSEVAFVHALKLALVTKAELEILHISRHPEQVEWSSFPAVRDTLIQWGVLSTGATHEDVAKLRISVYKAIRGGSEPRLPILEELDHRPADLIVLASHHPTGLDRWLHHEIASFVGRLARKTTLFVPHGSQGFVNIHSGNISLDRVLIPFDIDPHPQAAVDAALSLITLLKVGGASFDLLHVGPDDASVPVPHIPQQPNTRWNTMVVSGDDVVHQVLSFAASHRTPLIAMTTQGHHGFLDALRGSTTDQILQATECPLLAVPCH